MFFLCLVGQVLVYYNYLNIGWLMDYDNFGKYILCYFDEVNGLFYLFGYGFSYIEFSFLFLCLFSEWLVCGVILEVWVMFSNSGKCVGVMVVQFYLQDLVVSFSCLVKELCGFCKVMLEFGELWEIVFCFGEVDLKFYDSQFRYMVELGEFKVFVGLDLV